MTTEEKLAGQILNELTAGEVRTSTSIPILMCEKVRSEKWYMLRLTPDDVYTLQNLKDDLLLSFDGNWIIGKEKSKKDKLHYHIVFNWADGMEMTRKIVKGFLIEHYGNDWGKADGNKRYNLQETRDLRKVMQYTVKDLDVEYGDNINPDYINKVKDESFKKYDKVCFMSELEEIKASFKIGMFTTKECCVKVAKLKGKYRQPIDINRIKAQVLSYEVNRNESVAETLFD